MVFVTTLFIGIESEKYLGLSKGRHIWIVTLTTQSLAHV